MHSINDVTELAEDKRRHMARRCAHFNLKKAVRATTQRYDEALSRVDLRISQFTLLVSSSLAGPSSIGDLAEQLAVDRTTLRRKSSPRLSPTFRSRSSRSMLSPSVSCCTPTRSSSSFGSGRMRGPIKRVRTRQWLEFCSSRLKRVSDLSTTRSILPLVTLQTSHSRPFRAARRLPIRRAPDLIRRGTH